MWSAVIHSSQVTTESISLLRDLCSFPEVSFPLVSNTFLIWNGNFPLQIQRLRSLCKTNKTKENITSFFESIGYFFNLYSKTHFILMPRKIIREKFHSNYEFYHQVLTCELASRFVSKSISGLPLRAHL